MEEQLKDLLIEVIQLGDYAMSNPNYYEWWVEFGNRVKNLIGEVPPISYAEEGLIIDEE